MIARTIVVAMLVTFGAVWMTGALAGETTDETSTASLESISKLVGDWLKVDEDGKLTDEIVTSFRTTASGTAVVETLFPGTDHEMMTVYHQDGKDLVLTHYCAMGNQPRMKADSSSTDRKITFKCTGGSNMASENDAHMHEGRLTWLSEDRMKIEWLKFEEGKHTYTAEFKLARKPGSSS